MKLGVTGQRVGWLIGDEGFGERQRAKGGRCAVGKFATINKYLLLMRRVLLAWGSAATAAEGGTDAHLSQEGLKFDVLPARREQYLELGRYLSCPRYPVFERIDRVEVDGVSVEALARMGDGYLQRHPEGP